MIILKKGINLKLLQSLSFILWLFSQKSYSLDFLLVAGLQHLVVWIIKS